MVSYQKGLSRICGIDWDCSSGKDRDCVLNDVMNVSDRIGNVLVEILYSRYLI